MLRKNWKIVVMGLLVLSLAVAGVGFASAQGNGPSGSPVRPAVHRIGKQIVSTIADALGMEPQDLVEEIRSGKSILKVADEKGVTKGQLLQAVEDVEKEKIQKLVDDGKITQEQMDWILERSQQRLGEFLEREGTGAISGRHNPAARSIWSAVAEKLGMDESELRHEMLSKSLAAIAKEKGVSMDDLVQTMESAYKASMQKLVDDGKITQEQADEAVQRFDEHAKECMTQGEGLGCGWGFRRGGRIARPFLGGKDDFRAHHGRWNRGQGPRDGGCRGAGRRAGPRW